MAIEQFPFESYAIQDVVVCIRALLQARTQQKMNCKCDFRKVPIRTQTQSEGTTKLDKILFRIQPQKSLKSELITKSL